MGRPFERELEELDHTYVWALGQPIAALARAVARTANGALLPVGSGGSFTAAVFAAVLHERFTGRVSRPVTPLDLRSSLPFLRPVNALFVSAGGRNKDVIDAARDLLAHDPRSVAVLCASVGSPLAATVGKYCDATIEEFKNPSGRDGFLATNSLLAFCVLLYRAYADVFSAPPLPENLDQLVGLPGNRRGAQVTTGTKQLWARDVLVVLHGRDTATAAADLESKFTEAALGVVQVADFRNFGHGRHHWLAKHGRLQAVLALTTPAERDLARRTLKLIPSSVPTAQVQVQQDGPVAAIAALVHVYYLAAAAGRARKLDPGRPGVPSFGSKLYGLRAAPPRKVAAVERAIARKRAAGGPRADSANANQFWMTAYEHFARRLTAAHFGGVVLDYDGTMCDARTRFGDIDDDLAREIVRLLRGGLLIGVATGRGVSVQGALHKAIPKQLWRHVVVGYYNSGHIAALGEPLPERVKQPCKALAAAATLLSQDPRLRELATITPRYPQVTVEPKNSVDADTVFELVQQRLALMADPQIRCVRSTHSLDVLAPGVSKIALVQHLAPLVAKSQELLCLGDRGQFPGNDFAILGTPYSLSADEVSGDPDSCWNLAPAGAKGSRATLGYLQAVVKRGRAWRFDVGNLS
jgi:hydroxymethylpyrimidine pyrophosphatase-like HAD family hydrolase/fructoselysine-6-P-deglycase FrlB-like protein